MAESSPPHSSFMKEARAHYRMKGGKLLIAAIALLVLTLLALVMKLDKAYYGFESPQRTVFFVMIDLLLLLALVAYAVQHRARLLWTRAHDGLLGTRLQTRIITMFCGIAIVPTLIVATFSILFFNVGIKSWFDHQVSGALEDSVMVATAYVEEHKEAIRTAATSLGDALQQAEIQDLADPRFSSYLTMQASQRNLSEAILFDRAQVLARSALSFSLTFERLPEEVLARADNGRVAVFGDDHNKIQAVVKLSGRPELYLMVTRVVDPKVLDHMETARQTVGEFQKLQSQHSVLQRQFFVVFILISFIVLLASLWAGIMLAVRLIEPLRALMLATEHVRGGDYSIRVPEGRADDEIANLGRTFNRMTGQLEAQRRDLIDANRLADERRRFTEAVLLGVSAGVLAVDADQRVSLSNRTALDLLGREGSLIGENIDALLPEIATLMTQVQQKPDRVANGQMLVQAKEKRLTLQVHVTAERLGNAIESYIVTFDDITALVSAQRSAAWADVARRIAHEIKNPLTPITLSAERLRKKFGHAVAADEKESFEKYIDTIARHTRDIGRMVEEFVAYARMPSSVFKPDNLASIVRKTVFSAQTANPDIQYVQSLPSQEVMLMCDEGQLGQALLNLLKNAAEALEGREEKRITIRLEKRPHPKIMQNDFRPLPVGEVAPSRTTSEPLPPGEVDAPLSASGEGGYAILTIEDNGAGFPADKIATLTEPYVTTRAKGTGLGLAIVKRSIEEHKGTLTLSNAETGGAQVTMVFPLG